MQLFTFRFVGASSAVQGRSSKELQKDQCEKESICEEEAVSKMPQKHQDNP